MLSMFNILLQVIQSVDTAKLANYEKLKSLGKKLMGHLKNNFLIEKGESWVMIIPTVHQTCAHSWEMFQMNGGKCIVKWSENPLESWNKSVRAFQSQGTSKFHEK